MDSTQLTRDVIDFWFGEPESSELGARRAIWFDSDGEFDETIKQRFGQANSLAVRGSLDQMMAEQMSCLALVIILDQFSRNIYRDREQAFANDAKARDVVHHALAQGFDNNLLTVHRVFFYLPFEHHEDAAGQERSVECFLRLGDAQSLQHALCHRDQIIRFGRFPGRNKALGRTSTPAEVAFLKAPFC